MTQCLTPNCLDYNPTSHFFCQKCGATLRLGDRYRPISLIGEGAFGRTFKAVDEHRLNTPCVIKQFIFTDPNPKTLEKAVVLFKQEAQRLFELGKHPQIPDLFAYFEQEGKSYLIQELVDGEDLLKVLQQQTLSETEVKQFLLDLLPVLQFIHERNVIHRDIKPDNIIRAKDGKLVLIDFGVSKQINAITTVGTTTGTPGYASPEQMRGMVYPASDLYGLGVTAIRLLTGCIPQQRNNSLIDEIYNPLEMKWVWRDYLQQQGKTVSPTLGEILDKLIQEKVKNRFQSAEEALNALKTNSISVNIGYRFLQNIFTKLQQTTVISPNSAPKESQTVQNPLYQPPSKPQPTIIVGNSPQPVTTQPQRSNLGFSAKNSDYPTQTFSYETVTVKVTASGIDYEQKQGKANYFTVHLGNSETLDMVAIPPGKFLMGAPESEEESKNYERPQHWVTLQSFYMSKFPITQGQYQGIMGENPSRFNGQNQPVERVSWDNAIKFCEKLSQKTRLKFSLPSESQWEYACRAGTTTPFYYGETITTDLTNYNGNYVYGNGLKGGYRKKTTDVRSFPLNAFGLYDMHGNVWEWCTDTWHDDYHNAVNNGSAWVNQESSRCVIRGGSWVDNPKNCRSASRNYFERENYSHHIGFRVICPLNITKIRT
ncbi:bifunctional serine/threonine-protein kinase/formylglycine-generating enzyme family protein [Crocosphaera sp. XPORK-15E]|uniref:bifunctional serine/threonine-protein kinase/formylglycine-generating enzyme family protein n=1 Tax=Crocosphaera sp. XPORK-15E TaxID=3110247 RepID=UPI002B1F6BDF|nr:bifunctional serine/threonine-protein kinase/formylglycine-generating enzyme family protein [Crocosphaera sp. XPORK-15E]MEA5534070.1 bifunctional serine/threonine-protein kinase/formylglycine-generating enzyme family protein [Crocosphaera sp. XPORK-15E]